MTQIIAAFIGNFPFIMTVLALIIGLIASAKSSNPSKSHIILGYLFFFSVGLGGLWGFIFHAFFPALSAKMIGWATSPFQFEVAVANLGIGLVGIFGLRAAKPYYFAGTIFTTCFLWGAAYGHIIQMLTVDNFAPGNAGLIFYNDLFLPALLIIFLSF
jgi:hypothetical protein